MAQGSLISFVKNCATKSSKNLWQSHQPSLNNLELRCRPSASWSCSGGASQFIKHRTFSTESEDKGLKAASQILSKLFPHPATTEKEETDSEKKKKEETDEAKKEKARKHIKFGFAVCGASAIAMGIWGVYEFGKPDYGVEGNIIEDEFSKDPAVQQYIKRMWKIINFYKKWIQEPAQNRLLPDVLKFPYIQPPYTLVLEMKDVLVHPDWTYQTGWRFKKRPGVDYFLQECAKDFEIVVFTNGKGNVEFPILDALDSKGYIMYRLMRGATYFVDGHHVKNLDYLNRDLKKVVVIDWDANSTKLHPENSFNIGRWLGNDDDASLFDLINFLKTLASAEVEDVRVVLSYYKQFEDPLQQFRENQHKLLEQMEEHEREEKAKTEPIVKKWTTSFLKRS